MRRALPALLVFALCAAACSGGGGTPTPTTPTPAGPRPHSTAVLAIVSPSEGATVHGPTVTVRVSLKHAKIVQPTSTHLVPNEGHIHVKLDGALITMTGSLVTTVPVHPGHHVIEVDFVANDHFPFDPPVVALVSFDVKG